MGSSGGEELRVSAVGADKKARRETADFDEAELEALPMRWRTWLVFNGPRVTEEMGVILRSK